MKALVFHNLSDIPERMLLKAYKEGKQVAECDITDMPTRELEIVLKIQEKLGRTWEYKLE